MKWLATTFLSVLAISAHAQDNDLIVLPTVAMCSEKNPESRLKERFGEIGFLEGDAKIFLDDQQAVTGTVKIYLDPNRPNGFTVMFEAGKLFCMIVNGENIQPMLGGERL